MSETHAPHVIDVTPEGFQREVLERSRDLPVLVDFWAAWCGPCRQLGPVLERLAAEYAGAFVLAKVDTDRAADLAADFGVRGIPAVFAVRDGRVVDSFVGVLPETQIRAFLDRLRPTPTQILCREAEALLAADPAAAEPKFREAADLEPKDFRARIGLGRALLALDRHDEAAAVVAELERRGYLEPEGEALKAELTVRRGAADAGDLASARRNAEADPSDLPAQFRLAEALAAAGDHAEALAVALDLVERDRRGVGEEARKLMLAIFALLPADSHLAAEYRRQLSFAL